MSGPQRKFVEALAREKGLTICGAEALTVRRQRCGKGFCFRLESGALLREAGEVARLKALAVPPAYRDVRYAADASAHLQAVGTDAAGRLQYRYHPRWTEVREALKARRLAGLARSLPDIQRAVGRALQAEAVDCAFVAAAVVQLVRLTAIRAGSEAYVREHGTRGATTLLKSNVTLGERIVTLHFKAKGGKAVSKVVRNARLHAAVKTLMALPGRRLFQYRDAEGMLHPVRAADVNAYLCAIAGRRISLKDFRTLVASTAVLEALTAAEPAASERARRSQVRSAVTAVAEELANTPTICRKSYVHDAVINAFEQGALARLRKPARSATKTAEVLARIVARHSA
jgi:DNA topoisomerase-1